MLINKITFLLREKQATLMQYERIEVNDKLSDFLHNFIGTKKTYELAKEICDSILGKTYLKIDSKSYRVTTNEEGMMIFIEEIFPVKKILEDRNFGFSLEEIDEVISYIDGNSNDCKDIWLKGIHFFDYDEFILNKKNQLQLRLNMITGKRRIEKFIKSFEEFAEQQTSRIFVQTGLKNFYTLDWENNQPVIKVENSPYEIICDFLSKMNIFDEEDMNAFMYGEPQWIPRGFKYLTGSIETGYVVEDEMQNQYVYIPDFNIYISRYPIGNIVFKNQLSGTEIFESKAYNIQEELNLQREKWNNGSDNYMISRPCHALIFTNKCQYSLALCGFFEDIKRQFTVSGSKVYNVDFSDANWIYASKGKRLKFPDPHPDPLDSYYGTLSKIDQFEKIYIEEDTVVCEKKAGIINFGGESFSVRGFLENAKELDEKRDYTELLREFNIIK